MEEARMSTTLERPAHQNGSTLLPVDAITPNPFQPRKRFDEAKLQRLAHSLGKNGVLQAIMVRPAGHAKRPPSR
jgi:ParB family chromosome partitioning protein